MSDDPGSMTRLRRILRGAAVVWLSGQLVLAVFTPLAVWTDPAGFHAAACTCTHGVDAACPMHRHSAPGSKTCALRGAAEHAAVLFASMFGATGLPAHGPQFPVPTSSTTAAIVEGQISIEHPGSPDPPPPRS